MRDVVLIQVARGAALAPVVRQSLDLLDGAYRGEAIHAHQSWMNEDAGLALIQSTAEGAVDAFDMHRVPAEAFSYSGFVTEAVFAPEGLCSIIRIDGSGNLEVARSPGGLATFFHADARHRRAHVWSSHGGVEGVFVTRGPACLAISNRPLLSHLIGMQRERPVMSRRWAGRILLGNSTLWDDTPFEGTVQPPPRTLVVVDDGKLVHKPHPIPLGRRRFGDRDPAGIQALNAAALEAVSVLRRWPRAELMLSGGKDSRYAAALVRRAGIDVDLVTHATPTTGEGPAAMAVARALGMPHRFDDAGGIATGEELLPVVLANLRRRDGLLAENRHLAYRQRHAGNPLVQGQAHHPRGGAKVPVTRWRRKVKKILVRRNMGDQDLLIGDLAAERRARLDGILDGYRVDHPVELAYWIYGDWRMTRWTIADHMAASRSRPVLWPMMDERVLQVISELSPVDRTSEVAFFSALHALAPELSSIPLYEAHWSFDGSDLGRRLFPEGFEQRRHPFKESGGGRSPERRVATIQPLFRKATTDLAYAAELRSLISPGVLRALRDEPDPAAALGLSHSRVIQFMWKATAVALVVDGSWFPASAQGADTMVSGKSSRV